MEHLVVVGLALDGQPCGRTMERVALLSKEMDRGQRTVRRRLDEALARLADAAVSEPDTIASARPVPWHMARLVATVRVRRGLLEVVEERHIVSHRPGLAEIELSHTVMPAAGGNVDPGRVQFTVLRGGRLTERESVSASRTGARITLPAPLDEGEAHVLSVQVKAEGEMESFFVSTPFHPVQQFDLDITFVDYRPVRAWRIDGELPLEAGDASRPGAPLVIGRDSAVRAGFTGLEPRQSYGIGWADFPEPD